MVAVVAQSTRALERECFEPAMDALLVEPGPNRLNGDE
jgi:hypothetical protein